MKRFFKGRKGQKGFTLIELLVVIAILGVLAAVVIPNIASFIGSGTEEAANTEAAEAQLAVVAHMAANNLSDFDGDLGPATATEPELYLLNQASLQAVYTFTDGAISSAAKIVDSKWGDLVYAVGTGWAAP